MNWARRLKRVFGIDIEGCAGRGGSQICRATHASGGLWPNIRPVRQRRLRCRGGLNFLSADPPQ
jgi:hypothetical protein